MNDLTTAGKVLAMIAGIVAVACLASIITLSLSRDNAQPTTKTQPASISEPLQVTETTLKRDYGDYDMTFASMVLAWDDMSVIEQLDACESVEFLGPEYATDLVLEDLGHSSSTDERQAMIDFWYSGIPCG